MNYYINYNHEYYESNESNSTAHCHHYYIDIVVPYIILAHLVCL